MHPLQKQQLTVLNKCNLGSTWDVSNVGRDLWEPRGCGALGGEEKCKGAGAEEWDEVGGGGNPSNSLRARISWKELLASSFLCKFPNPLYGISVVAGLL